jgi:hypothetical protein
VARIGILVKIAKKIAVFKPPPIFHEQYNGTKARREKRRVLEKPSDPPASAGRGAFLIDGYYGRYCKYVSNEAVQRDSKHNSNWVEYTNGCCPHTAVLKFLKLGGWSFRSLNKLKFAL